MKYLLDTCVVSESTKELPNEKVINWLRNCDQSSLYISAITLGELQKGISRLADGKQKRRLDDWFTNDLRIRFCDKTIALDDEVMVGWGKIYAFLEVNGIRVPILDSMIAACAIAHGCILVTHNQKDFVAMNVSWLNPWTGESSAAIEL